jgi:hypothetical protein
MDFKVNENSGRPSDIQRVNAALEKSRPWGLEAELVWSLATHFKTYPSDSMEMAIQVALDDWDLDG